MNQDKCIRLIQLYQTYRFLWDAKDKTYHNKRKREDAWKEMSVKMELPVDSLKGKMKTLMGSYRSEKSREKKSRVTGSGSEDVYESKWFAYNYFDFICDKDKPRETQDTENAERPEEEASSEVIRNATQPATSSVTAAVTISANDQSQVSTVRSSSTSRMQKTGTKRKAAEENADSKVMGEALKLLQTSVNTANDPYYTYGLNLANELKKYDQRTLAHVKRAFANILFDADLGLFSAPKPYGSTVEPHYFPATSNPTSPTDIASTSRGYSSTTPSPLQIPILHELHRTSQFDSDSNSLPSNYSTLSSAQNWERRGMLLQLPPGTSGNSTEEDVDVTSIFLKL